MCLYGEGQHYKNLEVVLFHSFYLNLGGYYTHQKVNITKEVSFYREVINEQSGTFVLHFTSILIGTFCINTLYSTVVFLRSCLSNCECAFVFCFSTLNNQPQPDKSCIWALDCRLVMHRIIFCTRNISLLFMVFRKCFKHVKYYSLLFPFKPASTFPK